MKKRVSKMLAVFLLCSVIATSFASALVSYADSEASSVTDGYYHGEVESRVLWDTYSHDMKYRSHRIPGIVVTKKDTVIVYCEARTGDTSYSLKKADDWCMMDILIERSTDGGKTFGEPIYIAKGDYYNATMNNPVMIVGNDNTLHILYCKNYSLAGGGIWYRKSTDDGLTWSEERCLSEFAESVPHACFAFGPTHGICTKDGVLMAPVWLVPEGESRDGELTSHGPSKTYVFYSEDNGETWALSDVASGNSNETNIAQLSDGSIYLNSRATPRRITTSSNGINSWTTTYQDQQLPDPACCAGLVTVDLPGLPYAHLFSNCANTEARTKVTVKCSFDDGVTWEQPLLLAEYQGGYSDIAVDSKGKVYVLHEVSFGAQMKLVTFSFVDEFLQEDPTRTSQKTAFSFDSEDSLALASRFNHLDASITENALRLTSTDTKKHSFYLDFQSESKNLNLSDYRAIAFRMRVNSAEESDCAVATYFQSGRIYGSSGETHNSFTVPNDGEWHTVILDLDASGLTQGMLYGVRLELYSDTLRSTVGDTVDLASVQFYANADEARAALGLDGDASTAEPETAETPTAEPTPTGNGGCSSSALTFPVLLAAVPCAMLLRRRGKKR